MGFPSLPRILKVNFFLILSRLSSLVANFQPFGAPEATSEHVNFKTFLGEHPPHPSYDFNVGMALCKSSFLPPLKNSV